MYSIFLSVSRDESRWPFSVQFIPKHLPIEVKDSRFVHVSSTQIWQWLGTCTRQTRNWMTVTVTLHISFFRVLYFQYGIGRGLVLDSHLWRQYRDTLYLGLALGTAERLWRCQAWHVAEDYSIYDQWEPPGMPYNLECCPRRLRVIRFSPLC